MINYVTLLRCFPVILLFSCSASQPNYSPEKKYPKAVLQEEYVLLRNILEKKHPSLYWYTSKDSIDQYFELYYTQIADSMTEPQFAWHVLAPMVDKFRCGHTSVSLSKGYSKWVKEKKFSSFPLFFKVWDDSMAVTGNLNKKDSVFKRGTIVRSINGVDNKTLLKKMLDYLPQDGYAEGINYIRLSTNFPYYHRNIFGLSRQYSLTYSDSSGMLKSATIPLYTPPKDTTRRDSTTRRLPPAPKLPRENRLLEYRSLEVDSSGKFAVMRLNTFSKGKLRRFFRRSFRELKEKKIDNLILDIRLNGGGRVGVSTLLTKYLSRKPFRVCDSLSSHSKYLGPYTKYIKGKTLNNIELFFISKKRSDGKYHIGHFEKKIYKPKEKNHYNGNVYVLTSGPTFSASALFANAVKGQEGIMLLGEETGGGWYGNNGIMIPDIILPHTKIRVRLPLFRLVQYNHVAKTGSGIIPDLYVPTSYDALIKGYDKKLQVAKQLIQENK